jgi:hypothetical protein
MYPDPQQKVISEGGLWLPELDDFSQLSASSKIKYGTKAHASRGSEIAGVKPDGANKIKGSKLQLDDDVLDRLLKIPDKHGEPKPAMISMNTRDDIAQHLGFGTSHVYTGRLNVSPDVRSSISQKVATRRLDNGSVGINEPSIWYELQNAGLRADDFKIRGRSLGRMRDDRSISIPEEINVGFKHKQFKHMADFTNGSSS